VGGEEGADDVDGAAEGSCDGKEEGRKLGITEVDGSKELVGATERDGLKEIVGDVEGFSDGGEEGWVLGVREIEGGADTEGLREGDSDCREEGNCDTEGLKLGAKDRLGVSDGALLLGETVATDTGTADVALGATVGTLVTF
jgi:hypothetical protein